MKPHELHIMMWETEPTISFRRDTRTLNERHQRGDIAPLRTGGPLERSLDHSVEETPLKAALPQRSSFTSTCKIADQNIGTTNTNKRYKILHHDDVNTVRRPRFNHHAPVATPKQAYY